MTTQTPVLEVEEKHGLSTKAKLGLTAAAVVGATAGWIAFRQWHTHWGATPEETRGSLPGDELIPEAAANVTHAITIEAQPHCVWPWLAQLGQGKGGFYSYTAIENLLGCEMENADTVHPEWQNLKVGDPISFHPKYPTATIARLERERFMVIHGVFQGEAYSWAFVLRDLGYGKTRLIARLRGEQPEGLVRRMREEFLDGPAHFVMERKMLLTIKQRAEELASQTKTPVDEEC